MSIPLLSIIIPTCHRNEALALCLDCLVPGAQTLSSETYEVIVTDDGSTTTAQNLVAEHYPWAKWVAGPRKGPAANRNNGAAQAQGSYIVFTDDDCKPDTNWLNAYASALTSKTDIYEGKTICSVPFQGPLVIAPVNLEGGVLWSCNLMVRKSTFEALSGFDEGFPHAADEDTDFRERVQRAGYVCQFIPEALVDHPPVRRQWGRKSARLWESKVRLHYKYSSHSAYLTRFQIVTGALRTRLGQLMSSPLSYDSLAAFIGLPVELWWIFRQSRRWQRKHHSEFRSHS